MIYEPSEKNGKEPQKILNIIDYDLMLIQSKVNRNRRLMPYDITCCEVYQLLKNIGLNDNTITRILRNYDVFEYSPDDDINEKAVKFFSKTRVIGRYSRNQRKKK